MSVSRGLVSDCRKLRSLRSCSSALVIDILFVLRRLLSMVQTILQTIEFPLSPFVFGGRCHRYAGRAASLVPLWRRHCSHSCSSLRNCRPQLQFIKVVHIPVVVQRPIPMVLVTFKSLQLQFDKSLPTSAYLLLCPMQHRCIGQTAPHTASSCGEQVPGVAVPHYRDARMQHSHSR